MTTTLQEIPATDAEPEIVGSHKVTRLENGRILIHNLELFVGFDPTVDSDNGRIKKFDAGKIERIVSHTTEIMRRGQNPKLILGHNVEDEMAPLKPSIGDIVRIRMKSIHGAPGIVGDVEMDIFDFDSLLRKNQYPRRSAEILGGILLSEVALLGSQTPGRPLPDTKFAANDYQEVERFCRDVPTEAFAEPTATPHGPGPGNVLIPSSIKKKGSDMPDEDKDMKAKLKAAMDEIGELKKKLKDKNEADDEDKEKNAEEDEKKEKEKNAAVEEREKFFEKRIDGLENQLTREKYARRLDTLVTQGSRLSKERYDEILDRVSAAKDPEKEFEFFSKMIPRGHVGVDFDTENFAMQESLDPEMTDEEEERFGKAAQVRCLAERKPEMFSAYFEEERFKARKAG